MKRLALLPFLAAALVAAGCGSDSSTDEGTASGSEEVAMKKAEHAMAKDEQAMKSETAMMAGGARVKVVGSDYGRVIADGKGEAFYLFDKETTTKPRCYGTCAEAWPPVLTKGKPVAAGGAKQSLLGSTKRANGKIQVTYAGHPLYYYVGDSPGSILCHDVEEFGGRWLVVQPSGQAA